MPFQLFNEWRKSREKEEQQVWLCSRRSSFDQVEVSSAVAAWQFLLKNLFNSSLHYAWTNPILFDQRNDVWLHIFVCYDRNASTRTSSYLIRTKGVYSIESACIHQIGTANRSATLMQFYNRVAISNRFMQIEWQLIAMPTCNAAIWMSHVDVDCYKLLEI